MLLRLILERSIHVTRLPPNASLNLLLLLHPPSPPKEKSVELGVILTHPSHLFNSLCLFASVAKAVNLVARKTFVWNSLLVLLSFNSNLLRYAIAHPTPWVLDTYIDETSCSYVSGENILLYVCFLIWGIVYYSLPSLSEEWRITAVRGGGLGYHCWWLWDCMLLPPTSTTTETRWTIQPVHII